MKITAECKCGKSLEMTERVYDNCSIFLGICECGKFYNIDVQEASQHFIESYRVRKAEGLDG